MGRGEIIRPGNNGQRGFSYDLAVNGLIEDSRDNYHDKQGGEEETQDEEGGLAAGCRRGLGDAEGVDEDGCESFEDAHAGSSICLLRVGGCIGNLSGASKRERRAC